MLRSANHAEEEETEEFYDRLRATLRKSTEKEIVVMMGDFNAEAGDDNTGYASAVGRHGAKEKYRGVFEIQRSGDKTSRGSCMGMDYTKWIFVQRTTRL